LDDVLADPAGAADLLERMADETRDLGPGVLATVYAAIARGGELAALPRVLPARVKGQTVVVEATEAVVVDAPDLLPLLGFSPILPVDAGLALDLADALDVALASELADFEVVSEPQPGRPWSEVPGIGRALQRADVVRIPTATVLLHPRLLVRAIDGEPVDVAWRSIGDEDHVRAGDPSALGRALAWRTNQWQARAALSEALRAGTDESAGDLLDAEDAL
jgi:hypothetical protein